MQRYPSPVTLQAIYEFDASDDTQISLRPGDMLIMSREAEDWYRGVNNSGQEGWFPKGYVTFTN